MNENNQSVFILNNNMTTESAATRDQRIFATDGLSKQIQVFDSCGHFAEEITTVRTYRKLRYVDQSAVYTAISCCNRPIIYCTDLSFNENGSVLLDTTEQTACNDGCVQIVDCYSELVDASVAYVGETAFFIGVFSKGAYLFDSDGKRLTRLCKTDKNESLLDFISFGNEKYAMCTLKNGIRTITISENKSTQSAILSSDISFKMLIADNEVVYGLFSQGYIYNRIIPIYSNGVLNLPDSVASCLRRC